jgi:hypothetical protein
MLFLAVIISRVDDGHDDLLVGPMKPLERVHNLVSREETQPYLAFLVAGDEGLDADGLYKRREGCSHGWVLPADSPFRGRLDRRSPKRGVCI